jgi:nitrate/TMAO reductase-like tetraheme cytochrome c subunit
MLSYKRGIIVNKKVVLIILAAIAGIAVLGVIGAEYYTSQPSFCGSCHIMTTYYDSWKKSKHGEEGIACVECHYAPGEKRTLKAKFKGLGQLFSYLSVGDTEVRTPTIVSDLSCITSKCHPKGGNKKEGEYWAKTISFTEYEKDDKSKAVVSITHKAHYDQKTWIAGQELHCSTCHRHETGVKHIEVSQDICSLCHFKNTTLNEGRAKCSFCHTVPEKPFKKAEKPADNSVTHKVLEERKVSCAGCHLHLFFGKGLVKKEKCFHCHKKEERIIKEAANVKLMHEKHIAAQTAHCFNCHEPIKHKKDIEAFTYADAALLNCSQCHAEPHLYQRLLLSGEGGKGQEQPYPIQHHVLKTNCTACHVKDAFDGKGRKIKGADAQTCVDCHTEKEGKLIAKWKEDLADIMEETREIEKETIAAIDAAKGKVSEQIIGKAMALLKDGQENIRIVNAGGGVHNKKYAVLLLDIAVEKFDDAVAELQ